jgi:hypothetical protein
MKPRMLILSACVIVMLAIAAAVVAQDADKEKLIEIEKAFAANPNPGPQSVAVVKQYVYEGPVNQLTPMGRVGTLPKATIVEFSATGDPADPNVKSSQKLSDFHVDIYGTTALVSYKQTTTDTGHKDAALNITTHITCLDTFVKRNGTWYVIGGACSSSTPVSQSTWDAAKKAIAQEPKDIQQAYH